jgi:aminopeptidase-like protein
MIGLDLEEATLRHHTEEEVGVPFRFRKLFTGRIRENGRERKLGWVYNVRILAENGAPDGSRITRAASETGRARSVRVGDGIVTVISAADLDAVTKEQIARDRWATARGPAGDPAALERARVGVTVARPPLSKNASMREMLEKLWWIPRNIVSEGFDAALEALATQLPMTIHEYPSGMECWSWIVPEKWTCHEAFLETLDGRKLFSTADHPLHVVQYSLPFDGIVSREELLRHLHVSEKRPRAIPYIFKYYERDWGLCCSRETRDTLHDERYRVVIRSEFSFGTMRVGEVVIPGSSERSIVLCAHLCHPSQAMDDMSGIVVGMEVMRRLSRRRDLRYTYRYLIVPETIGSVAYLANNAALIPKMAGGLYLEMLGLDSPHAFQQTFTGDTPIDRAFAQGLREADPTSWTGAWRSVIGNDERQFNGPGVRVPMASLSRVRHPDDPQWPYPEYHTSDDNLSLVSEARLEESVAAVLSMIDALEAERIPVNHYQGEVFCSRYGLHIDPYTNLEGHNALFRIMDLVDGTRSLSQIAQACGVSVSAVRDVVDELARHHLVSWRDEETP